MINYNDGKAPNYDIIYNQNLYRQYNHELLDKKYASQEPEFDLNEYFYLKKQEHIIPEEIPRPSCSRRNKLFKCLRKPEPLYHTSPPSGKNLTHPTILAFFSNTLSIKIL